MALIKLVSALTLLSAYSYAQSTLGSRVIHVAVQSLPARPPLGLELPREEQGEPFYQADYSYQKNQPSEESGAPIYTEKLPTDQDYWTMLAQVNPAVETYTDLPSLPAQDLTPPLSVLQWNPDNDPTLYFQFPVEITKETVPTNTHPKKFHKVLVEKSKPINSRPKEEISLIPVSEDDLIRAEKQLQKAAYTQAKVEHQRKLQFERQQEKVNLNSPKSSLNKETGKGKRKKYMAHYSANATPDALEKEVTFIHVKPSNLNKTKNRDQDAQGAATGLWGSPSPSFPSQLGSHAGLGSYSDERLDFQMRGHAGPHSYKFGFDTGKGKGHERQFRYEERDNDGNVKGHYGFYDKHGKIHMIKYDADPHHGFHADHGDFNAHSF